MHYSTVFTLFSLIAFTQATVITARNANHISMYNTSACDDHDKYYKWKSTSTCACVPVDVKALSVFTDHEPLQQAISFTDANCKHTLGTLSKGKCVETGESFEDGGIGSVMFWLPGVCDIEASLKDIVGDVEHLLTIGAAAA